MKVDFFKRMLVKSFRNINATKNKYKKIKWSAIACYFFFLYLFSMIH